MKNKKSGEISLKFGVMSLVLMLLFGPFSLSADDKVGDAAYEAAAGLFNLGLWKQASESYKEYFAKHPRHKRADHAHFGLGLCYFNLKDYASAAVELKKAVEGKGPDRTESNLYLGQALLLKTPASPKSAEGAFRYGLLAMGFERTGIIRRNWDGESIKSWLKKTKDAKQKALAADVLVGMLESSYLQNDWKSVINKVSAFEGLVSGSRIEQRTRVLTGEAHAKLQEYKQAAIAYQAATKLKGGDAGDALFRLGLVRLDHLKEFEKAAKDFNAFTNKYANDPKKANATFNEALCYYRSYYSGKEDQLPKAIQTFETFYKTNRKHELAEAAQFYVGQLQHIRKEWKAAVKAFEPLMGSKNPTLDQLVFLLGDSYHQMKGWEKSAKYYMQFAKGNEKAINADVALHNAGVAYSNLRKPDNESAIAAYELLVAKCPSSSHLPSARLKLGIIHYEAGRFGQAQGALKQVPSSHPLKADADYFLAWSDLDNKKPLEAGRRFKVLRGRLEKTESGHQLIALSRLYQGIAEFEGRRFTESAQTLGGFVAAYEDHAKLDEAAYNLGLAQMELNRWDAAIKSFEKVPEKSNIHDRALYQAAWSKISAGKKAESIPYYKELLEKHPDSEYANSVTYELAEAEYETGGEKGGVDSVKRLTAFLNKTPAPSDELRRLSLYRLGHVHFEQKSYLPSAKAFEELLKDAPKNLVIFSAWQSGEARRQLALTAKGDARIREYRAALKNYRLTAKASVIGQGNQEELKQQALVRIGEALASLEDWKSSQNSFSQFVAAHPNHKLIRTACLGLGWSMHNQKNYAGAIASYEKTVEGGIRDDTGARAQFLLGECYLENDQPTKARTEFSKVYKLYAFPQWQSKALFEMARSFAQEDKTNEAKTVFNKLIEKYPDTPAATAAKDELKRLN